MHNKIPLAGQQEVLISKSHSISSPTIQDNQEKILTILFDVYRHCVNQYQAYPSLDNRKRAAFAYRHFCQEFAGWV